MDWSWDPPIRWVWMPTAALYDCSELHFWKVLFHPFGLMPTRIFHNFYCFVCWNVNLLWHSCQQRLPWSSCSRKRLGNAAPELAKCNPPTITDDSWSSRRKWSSQPLSFVSCCLPVLSQCGFSRCFRNSIHMSSRLSLVDFKTLHDSRVSQYKSGKHRTTNFPRN